MVGERSNYPHLPYHAHINKQLKDERSKVFAILVPLLCAETFVFAPSYPVHFAYMRYDVYAYVL